MSVAFTRLDGAVAAGHTAGMKVAISIPDEIFSEGEALAKRFGTSRSEIYRRALGEFIGRHAEEPVTRAMNEAIDSIGAAPDDFSAAACTARIEKSRLVISQADVWWADLGEPTGSAPGYRRPVVVVQGDAFNRSRIGTVVCVPLTSNMKWAEAPGNVMLSKRSTGLEKDSVANVSLLVALDKQQLVEHVGRISSRQLERVMVGIDIVLGR